MKDKELLWKQYNLYVELYKHYLELIIKFSVFYYAVTGAILSFYFSKEDVSVIKYSLLFPFFMSLGFGVFFIYSARLVHVVRDDLFAIRDALELNSAPEMKVLIVLLYLSAILFFRVTVITLILFLCGGNLTS